MKRFIAIIAIFAVSLCLYSCDYSSFYDEGYEDGYQDGHFDGEYYGYYEGIERAKEYIAFVVDEDLSSIAYDIEDQYGLHPEEALQILSNYADVPDEVDIEKVDDAIWAIYCYYNNMQKIINGIEDYWID